MVLPWIRMSLEVLALLTLQIFVPNKYFIGKKIMYKKYLYTTAIYLFYMSLYGWSEAFSRFILFSDPVWKLNPEQRIFEFTNDAVLSACHRLITYETYNTLNQVTYCQILPQVITRANVF